MHLLAHINSIKHKHLKVFQLLELLKFIKLLAIEISCKSSLP